MGPAGDDVSVLAASSAAPVAVDGVDFTPGEPYLIATTNRTVNGCGFSGPATPELEQAYSAASSP